MDIIPLKQFELELRDELEELRRQTGKTKAAWSDMLAYYVARHFLGLEGKQMLEACGMQGPGEEGIDLFWVEQGAKRVIVGQAETGSDLNLEKTVSRNIVSKMRRALSVLNDNYADGTPPRAIADAIEKYTEAISDGYSVEFWAIIGGRANKGLEREAKRFGNADLSMYQNHSFKLFDAARLLTRYCAEVERQPYPDIVLELSHKEFFVHGGNGLLASVIGRSIADAVNDKGLTIFESNARLPIQRSDVNPEIVATLETPEDRVHFWDFNNGLTVLCDTFKLRGKRIHITAAQIVNGCQTANTLSKNVDKLGCVSVISRIIQNAPPGLAEKIRRATNLQNAITERDLRSGDKVQKTLQLAFRRRGYFYERKRDEYRNVENELGRSSLKAQFPKGCIHNRHLAQLALAFWHEEPVAAKNEAKRIFLSSSGRPRKKKSKGGFYDKIFHQHVVCEELLLPYLAYEYLYQMFDIGYRPKGSRRTRKYMIQTHGDLIVLGLVGEGIRAKYGLHLPLGAAQRALLTNRLIPRFENYENQPEYFDGFDRGMKSLLAGLDRWLEKAVARQQKELGFSDIRDLFISSSTFSELLKNNYIRAGLQSFQRKLPDLE